MKHPFEPGHEEGHYKVTAEVTEDDILSMAVLVAEKRLARGNSINLSSPQAVRQHLKVLLQAHEHEVFGAIFLTTQHTILSFELLFRGTIDSATIHPREVVKTALACNAAAVILVHNHPSGHAQPSEADKRMTRRLVEALSLVDIRVLDHFIVGSEEVVSLAEMGLI